MTRRGPRSVGSAPDTAVGAARDGGVVLAAAAFLEAGTRAWLLARMQLKYVTETTELEVQTFGQL